MGDKIKMEQKSENNTTIVRVVLVYLLNFLIMVQKVDMPISITRMVLSQMAVKGQKTKILKMYNTVIW